jgi:NADH:ubiquinone oxidoreductase subunit
MLKFFKRLFAWWDGATLGALFDILRRARRVGEDEFGNAYFEERRVSLEGRPRRYVVYNGYADASRVPPDWHGWLHHTFKEPPTVAPLKRRAWEKEHRPNLTGTVHAYHPKGSLSRPGARAETSGDYEAWTPG